MSKKQNSSLSTQEHPDLQIQVVFFNSRDAHFRSSLGVQLNFLFTSTTSPCGMQSAVASPGTAAAGGVQGEAGWTDEAVRTRGIEMGSRSGP